MNARILVVDDNEQNRYLATFLLERAGHWVRSCVDGPEALRATEAESWDLILLDIQLPGMDGFAVLNRMRERRELDRTPIVAVSSYAMPGDHDSALNAGFAETIVKPIDPYTFAATIARHLER